VIPEIEFDKCEQAEPLEFLNSRTWQMEKVSGRQVDSSLVTS